jgi:hypothetical protein
MVVILRVMMTNNLEDWKNCDHRETTKHYCRHAVQGRHV